VYALGVVLYWLLTGRLPCEAATLDELVEATLHQVPEPPRVLNPRVPQALSALCMRMLEKWPEKRYPDGAGVYAALTEALAGADAEWAVPLCEPHDADKVTTQAELAKAGDDDGVERALRQARHAYERPRRGRRLAVPPPVELPVPPPAASELPASPPTPPEVEGGTAPGGRSRLSVAVRVAVGLVAVGAVGLGVAWLGPHLPRASSPPTAAELPGSTPRPTAAQPEPTWEICWKVAPPWKPPEATGPDLFGTEEAARVAPSSLREMGEASVKTPQQKQKKGLGSVGKAACTGAALLTVACTGPQVRPTPPGEACPAGALEAMAALGIPAELGVFFRNNLPHVNGVQQDYVTVKEGWIEGSEKPGDFGFTTLRLEGGNLGLSGRLFICGERVCGRFTEARSRSRGTFPVCLELWQDGKRGFEREAGSTEDNVKILVSGRVRPVKRFE
jgi:serine/threonine-protein kinase